MDRPTGVTVIGIMNILFGLVGICIGMVAATTALTAAMAASIRASNLFTGTLIIALGSAVAVFMVMLYGVQFYIGVGLLQLQKWSWTWARILAIIAIVAGAVQIVVALFGGDPAFEFPIGTGLNAVIIQAIVLIYLSRPGVKEHFTY